MRSMRMALCAVFAVAMVGLSGCQTAPKSEADKDALRSEVEAAMTKLKKADPGLQDVLNRSYGYAIFPSVGKGGLIVGGAYGKGEVYEQGRMIGYADMRQGSVGAQIGAQDFSELIVFQNRDALERFRNNNFTFGANASAVAIKAGAAAATEFKDGVAVFTMSNSGLMAEASVSGQQFTFRPMSDQ